MVDRKKLLSILDKQVKNKNIIKHMFAVEVCMVALAKRLKADNEDEWALAGLMHDGDYRDDVLVEKQGIEIADIMRKEAVEVSDSVAQAMAAHNRENTGVEPSSLMDWALFCCDSLTGLIVACALVRPDRKLASVTVESVLKKFPDKRFAAGTRREEIKMSQEKLDIPLEEFVEICLKAMQSISDDLGL